jgi:hypothetical protein
MMGRERSRKRLLHAGFHVSEINVQTSKSTEIDSGQIPGRTLAGGWW